MTTEVLELVQSDLLADGITAKGYGTSEASL